MSLRLRDHYSLDVSGGGQHMWVGVLAQWVVVWCRRIKWKTKGKQTLLISSHLPPKVSHPCRLHTTSSNCNQQQQRSPDNRMRESGRYRPHPEFRHRGNSLGALPFLVARVQQGYMLTQDPLLAGDSNEWRHIQCVAWLGVILL